MYIERIFSCDGVLKYKLKVGLVIGCTETLNEVTVYSHYNETNKPSACNILICLIIMAIQWQCVGTTYRGLKL